MWSKEEELSAVRTRQANSRLGGKTGKGLRGGTRAILQEQTQTFRNFRGDDGKIMKSLKSSVDVLYTLSNSTLLGDGVGLVRKILHSASFF
jgi:hypothetical protein